MRKESLLFLGGVVFFIPMAVIYGFWSGFEPVGTAAIALLGGLSGMIGVYFYLVSRRIDPRPEDNPDAMIDEGAGEQGVFSPWSWWPIVLGAAAALCFLGLAVGWWVFAIGAVLGVIGLLGWVYEFSRGQHAH